jgi:heme/copper-type cytochrome/quinol oxidase subunit 2
LWIIEEANGIGKGTLAIPIGKQIRIPMNTDDIINEFNEKVQDRVV